ncbi:D-alanyl-D-alanine carboxypeptidase [Microbacterium sp. M28]|uniref:D-alanyl-D-alanine carboxypeptidase n=1 Tax=Microbacterium sp. M28 TaxID=2962064 RepID=UPI0021F4B68D|nr:D-alanyl-D-alanine carboxypeptidase [Microbacterium sp. M28]UYO97416.1 D-alanyl-D-alanine carboxypeptidase [Microbacterium sp. M28]
MTLDEQTDGGGALTRREHRRRTGAIPTVVDADLDAAASEVAAAEVVSEAEIVAETAAVDDGTTEDADATRAIPVTTGSSAVNASEPEASAESGHSDTARSGAVVGSGTNVSADVPFEGEPAEAIDTRGAPSAPGARASDASGTTTSELSDSGVVVAAGSAPPMSAAAASVPTEVAPPEDDAALSSLLTEQDDQAEPQAAWADENSPPTALLWVDPAAVEAATQAAPLEAQSTDDAPDLLVGAPRRGFLQPGILIPLGTLVALGVAYTATVLLWPLHELPPTIEAVTVEPAAAGAAALTWPATGSAGVSVAGVGAAASTPEAAPIASITKVVSVMMVLDAMPLQPGEQGPEFAFDRGDSREYWSYLRDDQSALDVPVDGVLTEYQMLQGILLGSANNYIDRLAEEIWGSDREFAAAAEAWLSARGLDEIDIVTPSGRNENNVASPESLTALASIAMAHPVFAEIVGTRSVDLAGAGLVTNSNGLLADPGFVGLKTGSLDGDYNLLSGKDVTVGDTDVRIYAAVLGQKNNDERLAASRALYAQVEEQLNAQGPAVDAGTVVGQVSTAWGASSDIVTDADANVVLWNTAAPTAEVTFDLGETRDTEAPVGSVIVTGPVNATEVPVVLADEIEGPSAWWRLTHPFELLGITS